MQRKFTAPETKQTTSRGDEVNTKCQCSNCDPTSENEKIALNTTFGLSGALQEQEEVRQPYLIDHFRG